MSDLEGKLVNSLTWLIQGEVGNVTPYGRRLIAAWAVKTAMMFQTTTPRRFIPPEHFKEMFAHHRAPRQSFVWLGRYTDDTHSLGRFVFTPVGIGSVDKAGTDRPDAYGVTLTIGKLILQVFGHIADTKLSILRMGPGWAFDTQRARTVDRLRKQGHMIPHGIRKIGPELIQLWPIQGSRREKEALIMTPQGGFRDSELFALEQFFRRRKWDWSPVG